ncbi:Uncharacterised protein [Bordetella pertussis]|nr:Uncharacterised protein [Bordetella pertussis]CFU28859.1 Uncharacterised protein [Bordetella pertussis]CPI18838.1 Uncharacterised protein [Bordetella pertussis]CPK96521.1 Uncharacterised protein [Bordetella pertussis]CPO71840.1 Uncharacterised protein [Bordetella pertussis]
MAAATTGSIAAGTYQALTCTMAPASSWSTSSRLAPSGSGQRGGSAYSGSSPTPTSSLSRARIQPWKRQTIIQAVSAAAMVATTVI